MPPILIDDAVPDALAILQNACKSDGNRPAGRRQRRTNDLIASTFEPATDLRLCKSYISLVYANKVGPMDTAKIFWSGRSQAVRLPKAFRFQGNEVRIRRHGSAVILEPAAEDWNWLDAIAGELDNDFIRAVKEKPEPQKRPKLDKLFR